MIRVLDLFSGIGGFSLGLKKAGGFKTVCYVEIEPYCQEVLLRRMQDGQLDLAPIHGDITRFDGCPWNEAVDLISGGFPCQDLSLAGRREGIEGSRSGLWREFARIIGEIRPKFVLVENVPGLLIWGLGRVLGDLASLGYDAEWSCLSACRLGAPHTRERVFILGYAKRNGWDAGSLFFNGRKKRPHFSQKKGSSIGRLSGSERSSSWNGGCPESVRVAYGFPDKLDRLTASGNAIVPQIAEWIGRRILEATR